MIPEHDTSRPKSVTALAQNVTSKSPAIAARSRRGAETLETLAPQSVTLGSVSRGFSGGTSPAIGLGMETTHNGYTQEQEHIYSRLAWRAFGWDLRHLDDEQDALIVSRLDAIDPITPEI